MVENRVREVIIAAMDNLVIPNLELAIGSTDASSGQGAGRVVFCPDQKYLSGNVEIPRMTALSILDSNSEINWVDKRLLVFLLSRRVIFRSLFSHRTSQLLMTS